MSGCGCDGKFQGSLCRLENLARRLDNGLVHLSSLKCVTINCKQKSRVRTYDNDYGPYLSACVFINNSYLCIVIRTDEAHSIISSVIIVIIVIMLIIMIIGIIMVPCNHSSDISFLFSAVPSFLSPRVSPSHSLLRAYRQHSLNHQKSVYLAL